MAFNTLNWLGGSASHLSMKHLEHKNLQPQPAPTKFYCVSNLRYFGSMFMGCVQGLEPWLYIISPTISPEEPWLTGMEALKPAKEWEWMRRSTGTDWKLGSCRGLWNRVPVSRCETTQPKSWFGNHPNVSGQNAQSLAFSRSKFWLVDDLSWSGEISILARNHGFDMLGSPKKD